MKFLFIIVAILGVMSSTVHATRLDGFEGVYIGMSAGEVKAKGFTNCSDAFGEFCEYKGNTITSFYGDKIKNLTVGIKNKKVDNIGFEATNKLRNKLEKNISVRFGIPSAASGPNILVWNNGSVRITLNKYNASVNFEKNFISKGARPKALDQVVKDGRTLYGRLVKMEKQLNAVNHKYGFKENYVKAQAWRQIGFLEWYKDVDALEKECRIAESKETGDYKGDFILACAATNYLHQIGINVAHSKKMDKKLKTEVKAAFKIR